MARQPLIHSRLLLSSHRQAKQRRRIGSGSADGRISYHISLFLQKGDEVFTGQALFVPIVPGSVVVAPIIGIGGVYTQTREIHIQGDFASIECILPEQTAGQGLAHIITRGPQAECRVFTVFADEIDRLQHLLTGFAGIAE